MSLCNDDITRSLFARLRRTAKKEPESSLLMCPKCSNRLRPLLLDFFEERGVTYQRVWWTCRGLKTKTCIFPLNMPPEVFWTKRTDDQIRHDVIPLPNFNLLPKELWHLYPFLFSNKTMASKSKSKSIVQSSKEKADNVETSVEKEVVESEDPVIARPEAAKTPEDESNQNIPSPQNQQQEGFDELRERETTRKQGKKRKISIEDDELEKSTLRLSLGKKQLRGVVTTAKANSLLLQKIRRRSMQPMQERIVNGGRNFDFKLVDESTSTPTSNRVQFFPDIQASLKSALALRFAEKDYFDKVNVRMVESGVPFHEEVDSLEKQRLLKQFSEDFASIKPERTSPQLSQEDDRNEDDFETASSRGSEKSETIALDPTFKATSKAIHAFRDVEQKLILSSRLGIKKTTDNLLRNKIENNVQMFSNELFAPLSVQSDVSGISTSNLSVNSSTPVNTSLHENVSTNFESPELHNIVQKHLHLLKSKSCKKNKQKSRNINQHEGSTPSRPQHDDFTQDQQHTYEFNFEQEQDYGIFSLGDDNDIYGYDVLNNF